MSIPPFSGAPSPWKRGSSSSINYGAGNVGIFTTSPSEALEIGSTTASQNRLKTTSFFETDTAGTSETIRLFFNNPLNAQNNSAKNAIAFYDSSVSNTYAKVWAQAHNYLHNYNTFTFAPAAVNTSNNQITLPAFGYPINGWQVQFSTTGTLPNGLSLLTNYYVNKIDNNTITIYSDVGLTTLVTLTTQGTGIHTITPQLGYNNNHHQHFSIEVTDSGGQNKSSRFSIPYDFDTTEIGFFGSNVNVNSGLLRVTGATGSNRELRLTKTLSDNLTPDGTESRWGVRADNTAEGGANAGSNLQIVSYSDTGGSATNALFIRRSNQQIGIAGNTNPGANLDVGIASAGGSTVSIRMNRGTTSQFTNMIFDTAGSDQWSIGMRNDSTNNFHFRDSVNSRTPFKITQSTGQISLLNGQAVDTIDTDSTLAANLDTNLSTQKAIKAYVTNSVSDAIAAVNPAVAVQAATAAILQDTPTYSNGVSGIGSTLTAAATNTTLVVDGYTPVLNDRVLVKNQASALQNGIYTLTTVAVLGVAWVLTRAVDYDAPSDMNNTGAIPVVNGTANTQTQWVLTSKVNSVGTDAVTFTQFSINPTALITNTTTAGGDLTGTYPNPTVGANKVTLAKFVQTGTKGQFLTSQGGSTNASYQTYGTQVVDTGTTITNSDLLFHSLLSAGAITGGYPAFVNVGDTVRIIAGGSYINNSGATQTESISLLYGATTLFTNTEVLSTGSATKKSWVMSIDLICMAVSGSVGSLMLGGYHFMSSANSAAGMATAGAANNVNFGGNLVGSLATNAAQNLDIQGSFSTTTASASMLMNGLVLQFIPKLT